MGAAVCACCSVGSAWAAPIAHVSVSVSSVQEKMPPLVQKRIAASIQTVGNHVLLTHDSGEVLANGEEYNRIINDIVNRVLIGYTVESIQIQPGEDTTLAVQIRPWGETIQSVAMHVDYGALPDMGRRLADGDLRNASSIVENLLIGLPVDALDWADGTIKAVMESELESQLPEFYPHIAITTGRRAEVEIYLLPKLPVVRNVDVAIEAEHLPRVIFLSARKNIEERYAGLEGLPVAFVHRHERDIQADLRRSVDSQWVIRKYKLKVDPVVEVGENMKIQLCSRTDFYDIQAGAYVDVGFKSPFRPQNRRPSRGVYAGGIHAQLRRLEYHSRLLLPLGEIYPSRLSVRDGRRQQPRMGAPVPGQKMDASLRQGFDKS